MNIKRLFAFVLAIMVGCLTGCERKRELDEIPSVTAKYVSDIYPTAPVKVIVPYSEGGGTDKVARALVNAAKDSFPQGISVENVIGEGGATGMREGANAKPDGTVITTITVELTTLPHIDPDCGILYDKFRPIMMVNSAYSAVTVRADSPFNSLNDFIEYSKKNDVKVGNSGVGAIWHLASAGLAKAANTKFVDVPFDGGGAVAIDALLKGEVDAVTVSYAEASAEIEKGNLKPLAVLAPERMEEAPTVPTAVEQGYDAVVGTWRGFAVPKDTPDDICKELTYLMYKAVGSMDFVEFMTDTNNTIDILNGEDFGQRMANDNEQFKTLIDNIGIKGK